MGERWSRCRVRWERRRLDGRTRLPNAWMGGGEEGRTEAAGESDGGSAVLELVGEKLIEDAGTARSVVGNRFGLGGIGHPGSVLRVRGQDPMAAVPMHAGRRDELCEELEEFEGREHQESAAVGCRSRQTVDKPSVLGL